MVFKDIKSVEWERDAYERGRRDFAHAVRVKLHKGGLGSTGDVELDGEITAFAVKSYNAGYNDGIERAREILADQKIEAR